MSAIEPTFTRIAAAIEGDSQMKTRSISFAICLALTALSSQSAMAADWVGGSGWWDDGSNWSGNYFSPGAQPKNGDNVNLIQSDAINRTVSYRNTLYPTAVLNHLTINATGTGTMTFSQTQHTLATNYENIGSGGRAEVIQSGGSHIVGNSLLLGNQSTGNGRYTLSGTGSLSAGSETIGSGSSVGTFIQTGGVHAVTGALEIGYAGFSRGGYELSGGSLRAGNENIGSWGAASGSFIHSGGTHNIDNALVLAGNTTSSRGTYTLSGSASLAAKSEVVGAAGYGNFVQNGGTNATNRIDLGLSSGSSGTYHLNSGSLSAQREVVGLSGTGRFIQQGGSNNAGELILGYLSGGGNGVYALRGGTLNVGSGIYTLGGTSTLEIDGGNLSVGGGNGWVNVNSLRVGSTVGSNGSHTLSGTGTLVADNVTIGGQGNGSFIQTGGEFRIAGGMTLAENSGSTGSYHHASGTLNVQGGLLNNAGGSFTVNAGATATVGGTGFANHGVLAGNGTIAGNVISDGIVGPGNSPGTLTIAGDYTQSALGTYAMEIAGLAAGEYDVLKVTGTAFLDGILDVSLIGVAGNLFTPHAGNYFDILTADTISGTFGSLAFSGLLGTGLDWRLDYLTDFYGSTDVVRLRVIDTQIAPVPEPETYAMLLAGLGLMGLVARRRRRT